MFYRQKFRKDENTSKQAVRPNTKGMPASEKQGPLFQGRVVSIDALRGFAMFWIIGCNAIFRSLVEVRQHPVTEAIQQQTYHVKWEGFHFNDLIFPLFLFTVGVVLPFTVLRRLERGQSQRSVHLHIAKRTVILILLGMIRTGLLEFNFANITGGILQRIGLCYFFAALIVMHTKWRTQVVLAVTILVLHWGALLLSPVLGSGVDVLASECRLPWYISQLDYVGSLCTVLLGTLAGHWLRSVQSGNRKALGMALAGLASVFIGCLWGLSFPIIKKLWTSSFVLFAGGLSLLLLALFYWVIDVRGYKKWAIFFIVIGMNAIAIYFLDAIVNFKDIAYFFVKGAAEYTDIFKPLVLPLSALMVKWLFLWFLYRHKIFFKA